jgi:hypothetical protein
MTILSCELGLPPSFEKQTTTNSPAFKAENPQISVTLCIPISRPCVKKNPVHDMCVFGSEKADADTAKPQFKNEK